MILFRSTAVRRWSLLGYVFSAQSAVCSLLVALSVTLAPAIHAQDVAVESQSAPATTDDSAISDKTSTDTKPTEEARKSYLGRVVAKPMSHRGASWLTRPERDQEENASESLKKLELKAGMVVCDLGCGNGYWTLPMARDVGPEGAVYAVDIQGEMLQKLRQRADRFDLDNIRPVLGTIDDPKLPEDKIDLLLMVDVYHEFSHPQSMLWEIRRSLTATGVVALLEYRKEDETVPIKLLHKMSKRQIMKEYQENGFKLVREYNELPWQHLMFFARDDSPLDEITPKPAEQVLKELNEQP